MAFDQEVPALDRDTILRSLGIDPAILLYVQSGQAVMPTQSVPGPLLTVAVNSFRKEALREGHSTSKTYSGVLDRFVRHMETVWIGGPEASWTVDKVTVANIQDFVNKPKVDGSLRKPTTANRDLAILRTFFTWLQDREEIDGSPAHRVRRKDEPLGAPVALSQAEQQELLDLSRQGSYGLRNSTIIGVTLNTGLRAEEVGNLTWPCVDLEGGWLIVLDGKGNKDRAIPLLKATRDLLWYYKSASRDHQVHAPGCQNYVFLNSKGPRWGHPMTVDGLEKMLGPLLRKLNKPKGCNFHILRHSYAVNLLRRGLQTVYISALLGHESIATTQDYLRLGDREVADAVAKVYPEGVFVPHAQLEINTELRATLTGDMEW